MDGSEARIAQRCAASWVRIVRSESDAPPHLMVMASFETDKKPLHLAKRVWLPCRPDWVERVITHFLEERERA